jgi:hypothetical protein
MGFAETKSRSPLDRAGEAEGSTEP